MKDLSGGLVAEASAWLAVLHGPNRTTAVEQSLSRWLKAHPDHARAFELATEAWNEPLPKNVCRSLHLPTTRGNLTHFGLAAAVLAAIALGILQYVRQNSIGTGIGEQRLIVLEDRSRVLLNTATRIVVHYNGRERHIELKRGEALFEVSPQADRPFVVTVGDRKVTALGTSFSVRRDPSQIAITLIEGKVDVALGTHPHGGPEKSREILVAGQRLTLPDRSPPKLDQPEIDKVLAWQRREIALNNTSLYEAVAEMNRYSGIPLVLQDAQLSQLRISGRFRAGDSLSFARAVATTYPLNVVQKADQIVLAGKREEAK